MIQGLMESANGVFTNECQKKGPEDLKREAHHFKEHLSSEVRDCGKETPSVPIFENIQDFKEVVLVKSRAVLGGELQVWN